MKDSQPTFIRSKHDKQNPYVMISRDMLHDKSISPKAKGVLCYLLSLPNDWQVYHKQLMQALDIGEEYLNSAIDELIKTGYAKRSRQRVNGLFQPYTYEISENKIFLPEGENQAGSSSPENPDILKNESPTEINKETTTPAAVPSVPEEKKTAAIYDCLKDLNIPESDKTEICKYAEQSVQKVVKWATHPQTKINQTLQQAIKWALKQPKLPDIPKLPEDVSIENRHIASDFKAKAVIPSTMYFEVLIGEVEIGYTSCQKEPTILKYSEKGFKEQLANILNKYGIKCRKDKENDRT
jgi:hypothetical protein